MIDVEALAAALIVRAFDDELNPEWTDTHHPYCDETSDGIHRFDFDWWSHEVAENLAKAYAAAIEARGEIGVEPHLRKPE